MDVRLLEQQFHAYTLHVKGFARDTVRRNRNALQLFFKHSGVTDLGEVHSEMVRTIVVLAHNLGMDVIAEGVERSDQVRHLQALGCDYMQGYLLSKPVDAAGAEELLKGAPLSLGR